MTSCCIRYLNWFINQMVAPCFWSSRFMLSLLLEEKKKLSNFPQVHSSYSMARRQRGVQQAAIIRQTVVEIFVTSEKNWEKPITCTTFYDNFDTWVKTSDTETRRDYGPEGQKAKSIETNSQELPSSSPLNLSLLCRWGFLPAVSSHPLSDGRPQLASLFFLDKQQFHSPPPVRCVHIALPALPCARSHCLTPAAMWVLYRCLLEIPTGLTPFTPLVGQDVLPVTQ